MAGNEDFFSKLEEKTGIKIPPEQREAIKARLSAILSYEPKIGVFRKKARPSAGGRV